MRSLVRHPLRLLSLLAVVAAFAFSFSAARADDAVDARAFIERAAAQVRADAPQAAQSADQRDRFLKILDRDFDVAAMGRLVLGRHWANASEAARQDFIAAFRSYLAKSYAPRFFVYAGRPMTVASARSGSDGVVSVRTNVQEADNRNVGVDWHVTRTAGGMRIVDVVVEGVSLGLTQRDDFANYLRNNGDDVGKLTALLRDRSK
jgi:phospholipid transport system substrate-binding protein